MKLFLNKQKTELFIKTSLWNSVLEVFLEEKKIDLTSYLISVQIKGNILLFKTNNPLINNELNLFKDKIILLFNKKIKNLNLDFYDFEIKFV